MQMNGFGIAPRTQDNTSTLLGVEQQGPSLARERKWLLDNVSGEWSELPARTQSRENIHK